MLVKYLSHLRLLDHLLTLLIGRDTEEALLRSLVWSLIVTEHDVIVSRWSINFDDIERPRWLQQSMNGAARARLIRNPELLSYNVDLNLKELLLRGKLAVDFVFI